MARTDIRYSAPFRQDRFVFVCKRLFRQRPQRVHYSCEELGFYYNQNSMSSCNAWNARLCSGPTGTLLTA